MKKGQYTLCLFTHRHEEGTVYLVPLYNTDMKKGQYTLCLFTHRHEEGTVHLVPLYTQT